MINIRIYQLLRYYIFYAIQFTFGYTGKNQQISSYGKCMDFPFDFPQYWKIQQNHPSYGRTSEIGTHTFPQHRGFFSHEILILLYTSPHGKCIGFLINFTQHRKMQQNPTNRESVGNWYPCFFHSVNAFFHQLPILWYTS